MKLLIKQRVFAWADTYDIYDENGNAKYYVRAEMFTWGHQIHVYDRQDREVGFISQRIFTFLPKFDIYVGDIEKGMIQKEWAFFTHRFSINYNGWRCEGDFFGWDYDVFSDTQNIAHITKEWLRWGDTYTIDIANPQDELDVMMLCIAIDAANCSGND